MPDLIDKDIINICIACDDNYSMHAGVVIASIIANADKDDKLKIFILDGGIEAENKEKILSLSSIKKLNYCGIKFISIDENKFKDYLNIKTHKYVSLPTYYRLKLPSLLPDIDKIIYLDCDIVVNDSLAELFNIDFEDNLLLGVLDINKKRLKQNPSYVNAGAVVFNLKQMRKEEIEEKFLRYTKENSNKIKAGDQDIINNVLKGRIKTIDENWNVQSSNFINRSSYTKHPKIVHFVSKRKPWHFASFSVHKKLYFMYRSLTPWRLSEKSYRYWTTCSQIASLFAYIKYRPLFLLRPKFYYAIYQEYFKDILPKMFKPENFYKTLKTNILSKIKR